MPSSIGVRLRLRFGPRIVEELEMLRVLPIREDVVQERRHRDEQDVPREERKQQIPPTWA